MKRILALLLVCAMLALAGCEEKASPLNRSITSKAGSAQTDEATPTDSYVIEYIPIDDTGLSIPSIDADSVSVEEAEYSRFGNNMLSHYRKTPKLFERPETELTAKVKITKYCGDSDIKVYGNDVATLFTAKILTCYKGDFEAGDDICIMQFFSGHGNFEPGYPLFGVSDVMLLNLIHFTNDDVKAEDNIFIAVGDRSGIIDVTKYNGIEYAINRASLYYFDGCDITPVDEAMKNKVLSNYYEQDPVRKDIVPIFEIYAYKDLEKVIIEHYFKAKANKGEK